MSRRTSSAATRFWAASASVPMATDSVMVIPGPVLALLTDSMATCDAFRPAEAARALRRVSLAAVLGDPACVCAGTDIHGRHMLHND